MTIYFPTSAAEWASVGVGILLLSVGLYQVYRDWKNRKSLGGGGN